MAKKLVVGNWKLNPSTIEEAESIVRGVNKKVPRGVTVVLCPPSVLLGALAKRKKKFHVLFGVQDVFYESLGAFTGEYSGKLAWSVGADYAIVGHSERRAMGETNATVNKKVIAALKAGLKVILCVGEKERDHHGHYLSYLKAQINESCAGVPKNLLDKLIVAYEPVWAIGAKATRAVEPGELHEITLFIQKVLHEDFGKKAFTVPIIYGGSVDPAGAPALIELGNISGFLVGRESLKPQSFLAIAAAASGKHS